MARITEKKRVKIDRTCYDNEVCLCWRNKLGGWETWVFHTDQKFTVNVSDSAEFERFIDDLSTTSTIRDYLFKRANYEITLGYDNLAVEDIKGLEGMLMSKRVRMAITPKYTWPPVWITVLIPVQKFVTRESSLNRYSLEFNIRLPETLLQIQ